MALNDLLQQPLSQCGLSPEFSARARLMGFENLEDILAEAPKDLIANPHFNYDWLAELVAVLNKKGLLHLLQAMPGRTPG
ncbi:MAG: hypothetical protein V4592_08225 [Bacteroidota bacterium]